MIICAGTPTTVQLSGTFLTTTAFAPTIELLPIDIPPITFAPALIVTLSTIYGELSWATQKWTDCSNKNGNIRPGVQRKVDGSYEN